MSGSDDEKTGGWVESLGKVIGYMVIIPVSLPGLILLVFGFCASWYVLDHGDRETMTGSGIVVAGLLLSGAILQSTKRNAHQGKPRDRG